MINDLRQVYNDLSRYYSSRERRMWPIMDTWVERVKKGEKVLDIGCGEGRLLGGLKEGVDYTGVDLSKELIKIARKRHGGRGRKLMVGDITQERLWSNLGKFDHVFAVAVIHHLPRRREQLFVLEKIKEHLRPGGKAYVSFWDLWQRKFWGEHLKCWKLKLGVWPDSSRWVKIPFAGSNLRRFYFAGTRRYWKRLLAEAGWRDAKIGFDKDKENVWATFGQE